ncbi:hypothetical protein DFQ28_002290 [Apophysomyces sp. BC1034]|nr:hypothetical protein DFQ30_003985 [Apophysomyces sp. BC1015]KAG0178677.1 hypothetical protein DFQ29_003121 [Apophysomyces sp. BC1021]KAG0190253.1 hypothetical protein DFQ28_002290 [Apophysomyces sp. BC1034]
MTGQNGHFKHSEANGVPTGKEKAQRQPTSRFVSRVTSFPIIKDSVSTANALANRTRLGQLALSTANSTWSTLSSHQPAAVQNYYEAYLRPHVQKVDDLGCQSLDVIQSKFPVIAEPTGDILNKVITPTYQIIDGVKVRVNTTINTVTAPAYVVTRETNRRLGVVVDNVETVIERYLPSSEKKTPSAAATGSQAHDDPESTNQAWRAYAVLTDVSARLSQRVSDQVRAQWPIRDLPGLIQSTTESLQLLHETLRHSVVVYSRAAQERFAPDLPSRAQQLRTLARERLELLTQHVSSQLEQIQILVQAKSPQMPDWLKARLQSFIEITNDQLAFVKQEYARTDIPSYDKAKHVAQRLQDQILPSLQAIQSQIQKYTKKAQNDFKWPLEYIGLSHAKVQ